MKTSLTLAGALLLALASPAFAQTAPASPAADTAETTAAPTTNKDFVNPRGPGGRNITAFDRKAQSGIGGYYDLEFKMPLNGKISTFDQHRLILQTSSYLHDNLFFNAEVEFEHGGLINAGTRDGELKIEQAWADYRISDLLNFRAGVVLIPFGIVNVLHDSDVRDTTTRPLMASTIIPTTWMDSGVGFHGLAYPTEDLMVTYEAYVTNGLNDQINGNNGIRSARPSLANDNNGNKALSARVAVSPFLGLEVAANGYHGAYDVTGTRKLSMVGADAFYTAGPFEVLGEYANVLTEGGTYTAAGATSATSIPGSMEGYYVEGRYHFFPDFLQGTFLGAGGGFNTATFTAFSRYGGADTNKATASANAKTEVVVGVNYRPIQTFVTKLEYQRIGEVTTGKADDVLWSSVAVGF